MIVTPVVEFRRELPELIRNLSPAQVEFESTGIEREIERRHIESSNSKARHVVIVPPTESGRPPDIDAYE